MPVPTRRLPPVLMLLMVSFCPGMLGCSPTVPRGTQDKASGEDADSGPPESGEADGQDGSGGSDGGDGDSGEPALPSCVDGTPPEVPASDEDCDGDGVFDATELAEGTALDCDGSGRPDACEHLSAGCVTGHDEGWMEYRAGTLPIVLSAPHGGSLRPDSLLDRPDASTGGDTNTQELTLAVADALEARTGQRPHIVMMHLHRHKVEANSWDPADATAGQPEADAAFLRYHALIDHAREAVAWRYGRGLYVDLHGMAASRNTLELGYLLGASSYVVDDARLAHPGYAVHSSLRAAEARARALETGHSFPEMIRGPDSLGGRLQSWGYGAVPSPAEPWPVDEDGEPRGYFDGGYSTSAHGSRAGGVIDGVQIEHTWAGVRDTAENRAVYAAALADSLERWMGTFHGLPLDTTATVSLVATGPFSLWEAGAARELWVERRGAVEEALELGLEVDGDAHGVDVPEVVRFEPGERLAAVSLAAVDDEEETGPRELTLRLGTAPGVLLGATPARTVVVADDERPAVWLAADAAVVEEGTALALRLERDDCPTDIDPAVQLEGLVGTGLTLVHPERGALGDGAGAPMAAGEAVVALSLDSAPDGIAEPLKSVEIGLVEESFRAPLVLQRVDGDLDPALVLWLMPGEGAAVGTGADADSLPDHSGRQTPARRLPDADAGPVSEEGGLHFDGVDDVVLVDEAPLPTDAAPLTVAFWFRADADGGGYDYLLSHGHYSWSGALNIYLTPSGVLRTVPTGHAEEDDVDLLDVSSGLHDGVWHHYALVIDEVDGVWTGRVYLDGVLGNEAPRGEGGVSQAGLAMVLGGRHDTWTTTHFAGGLADLRVVHRAWSAAEVTAAAGAATAP